VNKIRAILVDDEARARNVLKSLLERNCPEIELLASCEDVPSAAEKIKELKPDLVFLDIQMPEYNGYELLKFVPDEKFEIIFVTAYDQYALKAFELSATDYLLKPVNRVRLKEAVGRVAEKMQLKTSFDTYQELAKSLTDKKFSQIVIASTEGKQVVKFDDIIGISGEGSYSKLYFTNQTSVLISKNLKYFQDALDIDKRFCRCHKSWIVNLNKVANTNTGNLILEMETGIEIKVSKSKRTELQDFLINI